MRRREFITFVGGAAAGWPLAVRAQQTALPLIGFLGSVTADEYAIRLRAFRQGLKEIGFVEGQSVTIAYRWAEGLNKRLPELAADLVHRHVDVLVAGGGTPSALSAKAATVTIPIVFEVGLDPIAVGLVSSLDRPGGNITGVTNLNVEIGPKRLEFLRELLPNSTIIAVLINPSSRALADSFLQSLRPAAITLGLQLRVLEASTEQETDKALAALGELRADALVIMPDVFFTAQSERLAALTVRYAVPAISIYRPFVAAGGLLSYGAEEADNYRLVGNYTGRILKGEKPADLPVQQSTKVELIINLKTAKALGITVPLDLSGRADELIE